tara:strand:+ start:60651 stop:60974 length:324 start_codon:yes stop_codon:yes gene_type:complete
MKITREYLKHLPDVEEMENKPKVSEIAELVINTGTVAPFIEGYEGQRDLHRMIIYAIGVAVERDGVAYEPNEFKLLYDHAVDQNGYHVVAKAIRLNCLTEYNVLKKL